MTHFITLYGEPKLSLPLSIRIGQGKWNRERIQDCIFHIGTDDARIAYHSFTSEVKLPQTHTADSNTSTSDFLLSKLKVVICLEFSVTSQGWNPNVFVIVSLGFSLLFPTHFIPQRILILPLLYKRTSELLGGSLL
jgi:hypothetical protein